MASERGQDTQLVKGGGFPGDGSESGGVPKATAAQLARK